MPLHVFPVQHFCRLAATAARTGRSQLRGQSWPWARQETFGWGLLLSPSPLDLPALRRQRRLKPPNGQVHRATLKDGQEVVIKVQHRGVGKRMASDLVRSPLHPPSLPRRTLFLEALDVPHVAGAVTERRCCWLAPQDNLSALTRLIAWLVRPPPGPPLPCWVRCFASAVGGKTTRGGGSAASF